MNNAPYTVEGEEGVEIRAKEEYKGEPVTGTTPILTMTDEDLTQEEQEQLITQVKSEYNAGKDHLLAKLNDYYQILRIYNNRRRKKDKVGEPLLFTVHQSLLAALTDDRMTVNFGGIETGDDEVAENLQTVAEYDYDLMGKAMLDYFWNWNTLLFGRACVLMADFDRDRMCPNPKLLDPLSLLRDPKGTVVNKSNFGRPVRYIGWETEVTKYELNQMSDDLMNLELLIPSQSALGSSDLLRRAKQERDQAQNRNSTELEKNTSDTKYVDETNWNTEYTVLEWFTHFKGRKCFVMLGNDQEIILRYRVIEGDEFPIVDKACYPSAHDWDGTSLGDLLEDKQRMKAILLNLGVEQARLDAYPVTIYDKNKIDTPSDLRTRKRRAIPVDGVVGNQVIMPITKNSPNMGLYNYIFNALDYSAQRATATPELQQGVISKDARTLGELNLVAAKVDTRYSLMSKLFAISEKKFWQYYYALLKINMKDDIDKKIVRIAGELNAYPVRTFTKSNLIATVDPDITIISKTLSDAQRIRSLQNYSQVYAVVRQSPDSNKRLADINLLKYSGLSKDVIDALYPPTDEEMLATDQNMLLNQDKLPKIAITDDHYLHILIHNKASDTPAKKAHILAHRLAMKKIREMQGEVTSQGLGIGTSMPVEGGQDQMSETTSSNEPSQQAMQGSNMADQGGAMMEVSNQGEQQ